MPMDFKSFFSENLVLRLFKGVIRLSGFLTKPINFVKALMVFALWLGLSCATGKKELPANPNIIFILADDLGYGDLGCYGQQLIKTPNIDQLAEEGMRFTQYYAGSTVCAPSRSVLMTGLHTGNTYVRGNGAEKNVIPSSAVTIAEVLKSQGYRTGMIGKWGLGEENTAGRPGNQGFDFYFGYLNQVLAHNYYPDYLLKNGDTVKLNNEVVYVDTTHWSKGLGSYSTKKVDYAHDLFTEEAISFIEREQNKPFFLYLPYTIPHNNGEAPQGQMWEVPSYGIYEKKNWTSSQKSYAAMISRLDRDVGLIIKKLKDISIDNNTLLVFTSDNGPVLPGINERFDSNGELRGGKRDLYEGGIRVPMIARWPGHISAGVTSDHISASWDFFSTLAELAGVKNIPANDGISLLPTWLDQDIQEVHPYLYWEFPAVGGRLAIRKGNWKAVKYNYFSSPGSDLELYNLAEDVGEQNNIAAENPEIVKEMESIFIKTHTPSAVFPFTQEERMTTTQLKQHTKN